ncbi:MAG: hypothetical protein IKZ87_08795 [Actinomycetaceae bacterium]|nr:hypothetical protein [Actinomycetaceae bacterium]
MTTTLQAEPLTRPTPAPIRLSRPPIHPEHPDMRLTEVTQHPRTWLDLPESPAREWDRCAISATCKPSAKRAESHKDIDLPLPENAPPVNKVAHALALNSLDILLGHRPVSVLRPWLTPDVFAVLARRASLALRIKGRAPRSQRPRIHNVSFYPVRKRAVEVAILAHDGQRGRAIAMRLEYLREKWRVVALEIG